MADREEFESKKQKAKKAEEKAQGNNNPLGKQGRGLSMEDTAFKSPQFTRHPVSVMLKAGQKLRLSASATGVPLPKFRWRHNGAIIEGQNANVLVVPNVRPSSSGAYICEAYNIAGIASSRTANVSVTVVEGANESAAGHVSITPEHLAVVPGTEFAFLAQLRGCEDSNPRFQWFKDGKRVKDATSPMLRISSAKEKYVGSYTVVVDTVHGVIQSDPARLELKKLPLPAGSAPAEAAPPAAALAPAAEPKLAAPIEAVVVSEEVERLLRRRAALETMLNRALTVLAKPVARVYPIDKSLGKSRKAA